jgi:hypothetical protein
MNPKSNTNALLPTEIYTGCPEVNLVWRTYALDLLRKPGLLISDTEDDLNWHAFLGHSIDMQGFRAAEFVGVDPLSKPGRFTPLIQRDIGVRELADLWEIEPIRQHLMKATGSPMTTTYAILRARGGAVGRSLAEAFETFPWRKGHWCVRALLQNSASLRKHQFSFRHWLEFECERLGVRDFPPSNFMQYVPFSGQTVSLENALRKRLELTFYRVGPLMAPYILCDWQLWLWNEGKTGLFESFKLDAFHQEFVKRYDRGVIPPDEPGFIGWWHGQAGCQEIPPRLANECIWLGIENGTV